MTTPNKQSPVDESNFSLWSTTGQRLANAMPTVGQKSGFVFCGDSAVSRLQ
ncbi:MAG: hypothetical protein O2866_03050 [archaeon]|nr:hypothetical protein [archaeon]MDA1167842.1 hypothetical protein [archaeon]